MASKVTEFHPTVEAAARLYVQHWLYCRETSFVLHPAILHQQNGLCVADIACGGGTWLADVARLMPPDTRLDGFDISVSHFPSPEMFPENITLRPLDALGPVPEKLIAQYDIIHVGRIGMYIRNNDPSILLNNVQKMLKPGGFLQWEEFDIESRRTICPKNVASPSFEKMRQFGNKLGSRIGLIHEWQSHLDREVEKTGGLKVLDSKRLHTSLDVGKCWSDIHLMAYRDFAESVPSALLRKGEDPPIEEIQQILGGVFEECSRGAQITMDIVYAIAQKSVPS